MDIKDLGWERQAPEVESGDYWFDGEILVTHNIMDKLSKLEITFIYGDIKNLVQQHGGQDYLQVYLQKEKNYKLFFIDQVSRKSLRLGERPKEDHHCTLMFAYEY